jgi:hypothetical protein
MSNDPMTNGIRELTVFTTFGCQCGGSNFVAKSRSFAEGRNRNSAVACELRFSDRTIVGDFCPEIGNSRQYCKIRFIPIPSKDKWFNFALLENTD